MHDEPTPAREPAVQAGTADAVEPSTPRQRWRLVLARSADAASQTQRDLADAWEATTLAAGLPVARTDGATPRPRISFGAPLPVGMAAEGELVDIVLTERWPIWRVREAVTTCLPEGWRLVDLLDVWLAGPPLAGRVVAADYRIELATAPAVDPSVLAGACRDLLASPRIERERAKGGGVVAYDLRPLVIDVRLTDAGPPAVLHVRTRFHPELGTGRPEEVVGALGTLAGASLTADTMVRERLLLADDLSEPA